MLTTSAVKQILKPWYRRAMRLLYAGKSYYCPVCHSQFRKFKDFGETKNAQCVYCGGFERHRLVSYFFENRTNLFDGEKKSVLHIAPEACFVDRFEERLGDSYITADLFDPQVKVTMDICDIDYPDNSFDVIYCSHVLEHVEDDRKAIREFHRVLKPFGWAILLVPISVDKTFEDPTITNPIERMQLFGQEDHVRAYGPDYINRLRDGGFTVRRYGVEEIIPKRSDIARMGIPDCEELFYCTKA